MISGDGGLASSALLLGKGTMLLKSFATCTTQSLLGQQTLPALALIVQYRTAGHKPALIPQR